MIFYIPFAHAAELSRLLWELTDADPSRGTSALFPVVEALDHSLWLRVSTLRRIPTLEDADASELKTLFAGEGVSPENVALFQEQVLASRGQRVVVWELIPEELKAQALDLQGMNAAGKLAQPEGGL